MAVSQSSAFWRDGSGLWPYFLATWGTIGFRSSRTSSSLSWNRDLRVVHRCRLASPEPETGGPLQHPVAQTAETGMVSTGFDRPVRPGVADQRSVPAPNTVRPGNQSSHIRCRDG